ncbi:MAG: hypothetical protein E7A10_03130, partial [Dermabacter sp.]|nr:hypothetical protein [Dermabacter sp.]
LAARSPAHGRTSTKALIRVVGALSLVLGLAAALIAIALVPVAFMRPEAIPSVMILVAVLAVFGALAWLLLPRTASK